MKMSCEADEMFIKAFYHTVYPVWFILIGTS